MNDSKGKTETASGDSQAREIFRLEAIAIIERYFNTLEIEKNTIEKSMNKKIDALNVIREALNHWLEP